MPYLVEDHRQIRIDKIRDRLSDGWLSTFSICGKVTQKLNAIPNKSGLILTWRRHNDSELLQQFVQIDYTNTNFNGKRAWFVCTRCGRKCGALFDFGGAWLCRTCGELKYSTASGSKSERIYSRIEFLKSKANIDEFQSLLDYLYDFNRPKRMRLNTWARIEAEHNNLIEQVNDYVLKTFGF